MGKAYKAPKNGDRTRYVSRHAVARLRERAEVPAHLDDDSLSRVLDDAVVAAYSLGKNENVVDEHGDPADLVDISGTLDGLTARGQVFALVKRNARENSEREEAVVTVLGDRSAELVRRETREGAGFGVMAEALRGVRVPEAPERPRNWIQDPEPPPPADPPEDRGWASAPDARKLLEEARERAPAELRAEAHAARADYVVIRAADAAALKRLSREEALEVLRATPDATLLRVVPFRVTVTVDLDG